MTSGTEEPSRSEARAGARSRRRFLQGAGATAAVGATGLIAWQAVDGSDDGGGSPLPSPSGSGTYTPPAAPAATADVRQQGAVGDGSTDDTAAFEQALQSAASIVVPPGTYLLTRTLDIPPTTRIVGGGKYNTTLLHGHDGDFARLGERCSLAELSIEGRGADFPGRGLVITGNDGLQSLQSVAILDFDGYCIDFETPDAGSQFRASQVDVGRTAAETGSERYAIHVAPEQQLASVPRSFVQLETQGLCAIDFGGCNDTYVVASTLGDLRFTPESRGVNISSSRLLNQLELTIDGHGVTIVGCDIAAQITLAPGSDHVVVAPNAFNRLPVIDESGNDRHQLPPPYSS
jgi:Pectate lyase superfamily protein/TAT (twin-arginine translocation) pathway signal sequence